MKQRDVLFLLFSGFLLVVVWVVFTILHSAITSKITDTQSQQIAPISPSFDTKTINYLKTKAQVTPEYSSLQPSPTPTPQITPIFPIIILPATGGGIKK